jgi:hypothetical protein
MVSVIFDDAEGNVGRNYRTLLDSGVLRKPLPGCCPMPMRAAPHLPQSSSRARPVVPEIYPALLLAVSRQLRSQPRGPPHIDREALASCFVRHGIPTTELSLVSVEQLVHENLRLGDDEEEDYRLLLPPAARLRSEEEEGRRPPRNVPALHPWPPRLHPWPPPEIGRWPPPLHPWPPPEIGRSAAWAGAMRDAILGAENAVARLRAAHVERGELRVGAADGDAAGEDENRDDDDAAAAAANGPPPRRRRRRN